MEYESRISRTMHTLGKIPLIGLPVFVYNASRALKTPMSDSLPELEKVNQNDLINRLEDGIKTLANKGLDREIILHQSLVTPACGMNNLSIPQAEKAMKLTIAISDYMRKKYLLNE